MKTKGQVRLRSRTMKGGGKSLYLDIYHKGFRRYEYLKMYLVEERTPSDREQNRETMRVAEAIRLRRMLDMQRQGSGLALPSERSVASLLKEWEDRSYRSEGSREVWRCWAGIVAQWKGSEVSLKDLSQEWWHRYVQWVKERGLNPTTTHHYLSRMRSVLSKAERDGLLMWNPSKGMKIPAVVKTQRVYLTEDELRKMKSVECPDRELGRAFLFGCFCGLRLSDIQALRWDDIEGRRVVLRIKKTGKIEYIDLNAQAVTLLGERGEGEVFRLRKDDRTNNNRILCKWAMIAGVSKHISFHTSRHTFAVLMLSAGVDIYTLSRLLGHSSVTTTQIYADIVDDRRRQAVDMFPII